MGRNWASFNPPRVLRIGTGSPPDRSAIPHQEDGRGSHKGYNATASAYERYKKYMGAKGGFGGALQASANPFHPVNDMGGTPGNGPAPSMVGGGLGGGLGGDLGDTFNIVKGKASSTTCVLPTQPVIRGCARSQLDPPPSNPIQPVIRGCARSQLALDDEGKGPPPKGDDAFQERLKHYNDRHVIVPPKSGLRENLSLGLGLGLWG